MKTGVFVLALALMAAPASATVFSFNTGPDLTNNFNRDVRPGDSGTHWEPGYGACNGFPASDGGIVYFDDYASSHSIQFKTGPVTLNSFQISSQRFVCGDGVGAANIAANDYLLRLYDAAGNVVHEEFRIIAAGGAWETLTFNIANVSTIWIASTRNATGEFGSGWWPVLDNVTVNAPVQSGVDDPPVSSLTTRVFPNPSPGPFVFEVPTATPGFVTLSIVDAAGRRIREVHAGTLDVGTHRFGWDGRDDAGIATPSGVYYLRCATSDVVQSERLVRLR
ncbi:MAG TPA: FlgD immunoglobulin-like domain containing protein [Candidatus Eisenbacteria bacterium]